MKHHIETLADRPELQAEVDAIHNHAWPRFVLEGHSPDGAVEKWYPLLDRFAEFQLLLLDGQQRLIAAGHTIPLIWDGRIEGLPAGWAGTMNDGFRALEERRQPTTLAALGIAVRPEQRGRGVAAELLHGMKRLATQRGLNALIAPVRPSWKERYPLAPIQQYVQWKRHGDEPFDPWIRTHWKMGAVALAVAERSMTITGTAGEWERWTGMAMPETGPYIVPGALSPVIIDREADRGTYEEPNYWMRHPV